MPPLPHDRARFKVDSDESATLACVDVERLLGTLRPIERELLEIRFGIASPPDFAWPKPTHEALGDYLGRKYRGRPFALAWARQVEAAVLGRLRAVAGGAE